MALDICGAPQGRVRQRDLRPSIFTYPNWRFGTHERELNRDCCVWRLFIIPIFGRCILNTSCFHVRIIQKRKFVEGGASKVLLENEYNKYSEKDF